MTSRPSLVPLLLLLLALSLAGCRSRTPASAGAPAPAALTSEAAATPEASATPGAAAKPALPTTGSYDWSVPAIFRGHIIGNGKKGFPQKLIAITLDDGPSPSQTPEALRILAKYHVHATFFVVGAYASLRPKLLTREAAEGHCIGIHSYSHLAWSTPAQAAKNIDMTAAVIYQATGKHPTVFRPPYGIVATPKHQNPKMPINNTLTLTARKDGYPVILWSMSSADTSQKILHDSAAIANNVIHTPNPGGAFVLMHDGGGHMSSIKALEQIIPQLQAKGWKFVTIPELLRAWADWMATQASAPAPAAAQPAAVTTPAAAVPAPETPGAAAPTP